MYLLMENVCTGSYSKRLPNPTGHRSQAGRSISEFIGNYFFSENVHAEANPSEASVPEAYQVWRHLAASKHISRTLCK